MDGEKWVAGAKEFFVCQSFVEKKAGQHINLVVDESFHLNSLDTAARKAERMVENNSVIGAIAYSITVDEEAGEYGEMENVRAFGETPSVEEY